MKAPIPQGLTGSPNYFGLLNNLMTLNFCESLREIGEMACVTSAWSSRGQTLNGPETNCGIAHILGILLMNSYNTDIFLATTIICSLSTLNCNNTYKNIKSTKNTPDIHIIQGIRIKVMPKV